MNEKRGRYARRACIAFSMLIIVATSVRCGSKSTERYIQHVGKALGTYYSITVAATMGDTTAQRIIDSTLNSVNAIFSIYDSTSTISRFNRTSQYIVHAEFARLLVESQRISLLTNGAYDPTVGAIARLWGFGAAPFEGIDTAQLTAAHGYTGYTLLRVHGDTVFKAHPRVELTLNAMAKGYASDRVALSLRERGYRAALVEVGGEIAAYGESPRGDAWRVGIDAPEKGHMPGEKLISTFTLDSGGVATSGNYREYLATKSGEWGHTIDPTTGQPVRNKLLSATVVAPTCAAADALATAMMVLGPNKSMELVEGIDGIECLLIYENEGRPTQWASAGFRDKAEGK